MLAGHFAFVYGAGARLARADRDHAARRPDARVLQPAPPGPHDLGHSRRSASSACSCSPGRSSRTTAGSGSTATTVAFAQVAPVIEQRCAPCHAQTPTEPGFSSPPAGIVLETPEQIAARAQRDQERRLDEGDAARQSHGHDERRARPRRRLGHPGRVHRKVGVTMLRITAGGVLVHRPPRGGGRAGDGGGVPAAAAARVAHHPRPLERRGRLDPVRRPRPRARPRERDVLSHTPARSSSTRAASPRPRSCSPTAT